jgi:hypothetical protein
MNGAGGHSLMLMVLLLVVLLIQSPLANNQKAADQLAEENRTYFVLVMK